MPEPAHAIGAVVFDLDGTLIDSHEVMRAAYLAAYREIVGDDDAPPFSEYCRHLGCSFPEIMRRLGLPAAMHPVFVRESTKNMHRIAVFAGVPALLDSLWRRAVPLAIATGKDHARTQAILMHLGLARYFAMVVGSDDVGRPKPAPDMALMIARALRLDRARTLFVGDAVADLACGRNAGMPVALATWGSPNDEALRFGADFVLATPAALLALDVPAHPTDERHAHAFTD